MTKEREKYDETIENRLECPPVVTSQRRDDGGESNTSGPAGRILYCENPSKKKNLKIESVLRKEAHNLGGDGSVRKGLVAIAALRRQRDDRAIQSGEWRWRRARGAV
jgi:hypothetical protein